jgi:hypothetical protein
MQVGLDKLKPGMMLAESVRNHQGMLLLESGKKISARAIRIFKSWGISQVQIRSRQSPPVSEANAEAAAAGCDIESSLKKKFADTLDEPVMVTIMEAARRVLCRRIGNEDPPAGY